MFHSFDVDIAKEYGVNAAIVFQDMGYWCEHSRINNANFYDGLYWTYNANHALQEHYPYLSGKAIRTAIQKLIDAGLLVTGNYNKVAFDRTMWYALTEYGCTLFQGGIIDFPKRANENFPKGQMTISQKGKPIPYTNPNTIPDTESIGRKRETFVPPTLQEVQEYAHEKGYTEREFDPESFVNFYGSKGWVVGKSRMKDWKKAASGWVSRYRKEHPQKADSEERQPQKTPWWQLPLEERQRLMEASENMGSGTM